MKIITNTEKEFTTKWAGISMLDGSLRFSIYDTTVIDAATVFSDPNETQKIKYDMEKGLVQEFEGYTELIGVNKFDTEIVVALMKGSD